ncbi:hypothetical protein, conserved [Leishmania donovani]|uniref:Uncharacterized protein n=1 Tax=Leishmania donovani TaxID=5661 RepID=A0A3S7WZN2_LEIDO|nr:hypothetical protein, conserved [Leishmania donovani]AYU79655.1 hypothetical protein LdCL_260011000 [Leishmania donovani]TPP41101.1 hypothetical protein CGC21_31660 [Leishmania donovani]CBZ34942.1 hypothetical protein, conserved [Leishmania donovani]
MSKAKDGAGVGSLNDSIPLDIEESSMSIYSDEEDDGDYDPSSQISEDAASSLDYSSVSRTYVSHSRTSGMHVHSEDYTGTASYYSNGGAASNSFSYDDEDYSSIYGSLSYGDSALRSPQSELSSTFASLYYENEYVVSMRSTLRFLRRPLYYFAFATAGSGAVGSICRLATTFAKRFVDSGASIADSSLGAYPGSAASGAGACSSLPSGYLNVPEWLRDVRASLPSLMEVPAAWMLRRHGIPVLSEVMQRQERESAAAAAATMAEQMNSGVQEVWQSWQKTGPAIPVALFLPIFSIVVFKVAQHVRPNSANLTEILRPRQDAEDVDAAPTHVKTPSPARPSLIMDASPIQALSSSAGNLSAQSASMNMLPTSRGTASATMSRHSATGDDSNAQPAPFVVPPVNIATITSVSPVVPRVGASDTDGVSPSSPGDYLGDSHDRSRSTTQVPQTHRHIADAAVPQDSEEGGKVLDADVDVDVAHSSLVSVSPSPRPAEGNHKPAGETPGTALPAASPSVSPLPRMPQALPEVSRAGRLVSVKDSPLRGEVVAAMAGVADVREANAAFIAAVRYGCSVVVLPSALRDVDGLLEAPPSLTVEFTDDVVASSTVLADRRGLTMVGVTAQQWDAQAEPLDTFAHPGNALYVFVAHESSSPAVLARVETAVAHRVFVGTSWAAVPVNQVFYDRLLKEKAVRKQQQEAQPQR